MPSADNTVEVVNLVKRYPTRPLPALSGVTLSVAGGEFVALMGPSGSGKSTLLNLVGALDSPTEGEIFVGGSPLGGLDDAELTAYRRRSLGFVFQTFHLIPALTALENVMTPMVAERGLRHRTARAREALEAVSLAGKESQLPGEMSGGEQQRVAIARALVMQPALLLADEPTGNLDARTGEDVVRLLTEVSAARGVTVLLATHDPRVALAAERVIALEDGRVLMDIPVRPDETPETLLGKMRERTSTA